LFRNMVLTTAFALGLAFAASAASAQKADINIGLYGPLTGPSAVPGESLKRGAQIAVDQINAHDGLLGRRVHLVEYDDRSSPEQALRAVTKLVQVDKVDAIIYAPGNQGFES